MGYYRNNQCFIHSMVLKFVNGLDFSKIDTKVNQLYFDKVESSFLRLGYHIWDMK